MALFGSRKGGKWWREVTKAEDEDAEARAKQKYLTCPTPKNHDEWKAATAKRERVQANYYD